MAVAGSLTYDTKIDKKGFEKGLSSLENATNKVTKGIITAVGAATTAIAGIGTASIKSYADLEQNVGGIETLFKENADKVIKNANNAYKTAGMSANQYMQTVTGFSASLLQSLKGDTEKASEVSNMALIDMSDNANKMGTSMESIQYAYQGFAKQNYTMLDNLKLGYGGTKEEMQRLLADAQKLTGIKYDITSLNDVFQAIHVIQENLEITGTTAKEAEDTISGSISSMKSAWDNFLNGSGTFDQFLETAKTVFDNIAKAAAELLPRIAKEIIDAIPDEIVNTMEELKNKVIEIIPYAEALGVVFLSWKIGTIIQNAVKGFQEAKLALSLYSLQAKGASIAQGLFNGTLTLGETLVGLLTGKVTLAQIATAGLSKAQAMLNAVMSANPITLIVIAIGALIAIFIVLWNNCESFRNFWINLWDNIKKIVSGAIDNIKKTFNKIISFVKSNWQGLLLLFVNPFAGAFKLLYDNCEGFRNFINNFIENVKNFFINGWNSIVSFFTETIPNAISTAISTVQETLATWGNNIATFFTETIPELWQSLIDWFINLPYNIGFALGEALGTILVWGMDIWNYLITNVPIWIESVGTFFSQLPGKIWTWLLTVINNVITWGTNVYNTATTWISNTINNIVSWFSQLPGRIWEWLCNAVNNIIQWGIDTYNTATNWISRTINSIVDWFAKLPGRIWTCLTNVINNVINWGRNLANKGLEAARNLFNNIVNTITSLPGQMLSLGENIVRGIWDGIGNLKNWIVEKVKELARGILDGMKSALGIHSPSKLFKDEVGRFIPQGVAVGIEADTDSALKAIGNMNDDIISEMNKAVAYETGSINAKASVKSNNSMLNVIQASISLDGSVEIDGQKAGKLMTPYITKTLRTGGAT